jgi:hypothetical protein
MPKSKESRVVFGTKSKAREQEWYTPQIKVDGEVREDLQVTSKKQNNALFTTFFSKPEQERRSSSQLSNPESIKRMSKSVNSKKDLYLAAIA